MNKFDKNFHINFTPLYITVFVMILMFVANSYAEDEIVESDLKKPEENNVVIHIDRVNDNLFIFNEKYKVYAYRKVRCGIKEGDLIIPLFENGQLLRHSKLMIRRPLPEDDKQFIDFGCFVEGIEEVKPLENVILTE